MIKRSSSFTDITNTGKIKRDGHLKKADVYTSSETIASEPRVSFSPTYSKVEKYESIDDMKRSSTIFSEQDLKITPADFLLPEPENKKQVPAFIQRKTKKLVNLRVETNLEKQASSSEKYLFDFESPTTTNGTVVEETTIPLLYKGYYQYIVDPLRVIEGLIPIATQPSARSSVIEEANIGPKKKINPKNGSDGSLFHSYQSNSSHSSSSEKNFSRVMKISLSTTDIKSLEKKSTIKSSQSQSQSQSLSFERQSLRAPRVSRAKAASTGYTRFSNGFFGSKRPSNDNSPPPPATPPYTYKSSNGNMNNDANFVEAYLYGPNSQPNRSSASSSQSSLLYSSSLLGRRLRGTVKGLKKSISTEILPCTSTSSLKSSPRLQVSRGKRSKSVEVNHEKPIARIPAPVVKIKETRVIYTKNDGYSTNDGELQGGKVNQYFIIKDIGSGAYGKVVLCQNELTRRYYACKVISKSQIRKKLRWNNHHRPVVVRKPDGEEKEGGGGMVDEDGCDIRREIAILKKISHPNINAMVEVLDDVKEDNLYMSKKK